MTLSSLEKTLFRNITLTLTYSPTYLYAHTPTHIVHFCSFIILMTKHRALLRTRIIFSFND